MARASEQNRSVSTSEVPIVGNVRKPRNTSSTECGTLIFDANFECGNLGRVDALSQNEYDLFIRPDTCNPKYRVWFYFSAENAKPDQRVVLNVVNFSKARTFFDNGSAAPVYRTNVDNVWKRIPAKNIYYYKSHPHGNRFILSFVHVFQSKIERCEFAYCIPYTYSQLQMFLSGIEKQKQPYFRRELLALSVQKRQIDLLTIASPTALSSSCQKVVFVMARVHPGETPSSIVLQGFIEFLISDSAKAERLRSTYIFKVIPMLNPDGVYLGNYRCSLMGFDLNRQWQSPSPWAHPSIAAAKHLLLQYDRSSGVELCMCLDLHSHSQQTNSFLYGNLTSQSPQKCERQLYIPYLMTELSDDYSLQYTQFNTDIEKAGTNRRAMGESLNVNCLCYTLEVSFFSYRLKDNPSAKLLPYLEENYKRLGENLALAILGYSEVLTGERTVEIDRPFETFLPKRCDKKSFKQQIGVRSSSQAS